MTSFGTTNLSNDIINLVDSTKKTIHYLEQKNTFNLMEGDKINRKFVNQISKISDFMKKKEMDLFIKNKTIKYKSKSKEKEKSSPINDIKNQLYLKNSNDNKGLLFSTEVNVLGDRKKMMLPEKHDIKEIINDGSFNYLSDDNEEKNNIKEIYNNINPINKETISYNNSNKLISPQNIISKRVVYQDDRNTTEENDINNLKGINYNFINQKNPLSLFKEIRQNNREMIEKRLAGRNNRKLPYHITKQYSHDFIEFNYKNSNLKCNEKLFNVDVIPAKLDHYDKLGVKEFMKLSENIRKPFRFKKN